MIVLLSANYTSKILTFQQLSAEEPQIPWHWFKTQVFCVVLNCMICKYVEGSKPQKYFNETFCVL